LFCIAGRCLAAENPGPNEPNVVRPPLNPLNPGALDAAAPMPTPVEDAAPATLDATLPIDSSTPAPDASEGSADAGE
jgi:hypothetical protein